jgi:2-haloalkanoic acid dehalogenase type II
MIHTIFFDAGGTLMTGDSTLKPIAEQMDPERKDEIFEFMRRKFMSIYLDENPSKFYSIKEILKICAVEAAREFDLADFSDKVQECYRRNHLDNDTLYSDTVPVLEKLKQRGIRLILISDADADVLEDQLAKYDLFRFFDGVIISSNTRAYKPSEKVVNEALKYCREPLSGVLFVGDTKVDVMTARKMKVRSVLIYRHNDYKTDSDYKILKLDEILEIIEKENR